MSSGLNNNFNLFGSGYAGLGDDSPDNFWCDRVVVVVVVVVVVTLRDSEGCIFAAKQAALRAPDTVHDKSMRPCMYMTATKLNIPQFEKRIA